MNSQIIQKLEIETDAWCDANFPTNWTDRVDEFLPLWNKKFAELIVRECINECKYAGDNDALVAAENIKELFGVE